jgi:CubicO group peptidase (beta-lactamase class C family)
MRYTNAIKAGQEHPCSAVVTSDNQQLPFHKITAFCILPLLLLLTACRPPQPEVFRPAKLGEIDASVEKAIAEDKTPGGVFWLERNGKVYSKAYGHMSLEPEIIPARVDAIYDAASLTKVVATTPSIMLLIERGEILLDAPVHRYLDNFKNGGKDTITIRHLMTHTSGLRPGIGLTIEVDGERVPWEGYDTAISLAKSEKVQHEPGTQFIYSDINYILLGEIIQQITGRQLEVFTREEIFEPLGMVDTGYLPSPDLIDRIAPTKWVDGVMLRGIANNPICRKTDGVHGHAGMFTTAADLARFARMILNKGELNGVRLLKPESVELMTSVQSPARIDDWRGLGWDMDTRYSKQRGTVFPLGGFGHTGFIGSSLWIDPYSNSFVIFMSNRVHPDGIGDVIELRHQLGTLAAEAIKDFDFNLVPNALTKVRNGIDVLEKQNFAALRGSTVGLITNHTGRNRKGTSTIDLLFESDQIELVTLFSPEHGIRGELDEKVGDSIDDRTGLTIHSLYGDSRKPTPQSLEDIDALIFDIQDIGCRFYTYISTMGLAMEAAAESGKKKIRSRSCKSDQWCYHRWTSPPG